MRRVLVFSTYFYPFNTMASMRAINIAKHLPSYGWEVDVVTTDWARTSPEMVSESMREAHDASSIVCEMPQWRTDNLKGLVASLRRPAYRKALFFRLMRNAFSRHVFLHPSEFYCQVEADLETRVAGRHYDAIWATSPDPACLALGSEFSLRWGTPWVADFRDIWEEPHIAPHPGRKKALMREEKTVLRNASAICTISPSLARCLEARHEREIEVIYNGYDEELFSGKAEPPRNEKLTLVYTGSLRSGIQDPTVFLEGLRQFLEQSSEARDRLRVDIYGRSGETQWREAVHRCGLPPDVVHYHGQVEHEIAVQAIREADILLFMTCLGELALLTGKLFEYLASGRPILAAPVDQGGACEMIESASAGACAATPEETRMVLEKWFAEWNAKGKVVSRTDHAYARQFTRRKQVGALAEVLERAAGSGS